jgi:hypothetical protein
MARSKRLLVKLILQSRYQEEHEMRPLRRRHVAAFHLEALV